MGSNWTNCSCTTLTSTRLRDWTCRLQLCLRPLQATWWCPNSKYRPGLFRPKTTNHPIPTPSSTVRFTSTSSNTIWTICKARQFTRIKTTFYTRVTFIKTTFLYHSHSKFNNLSSLFQTSARLHQLNHSIIHF